MSDRSSPRAETMQLIQIVTFFWAARLGSFVKAGRHLNATQSTISVRIKELEARLGVTLFHRSQGAARLTSEGETLLPLAEAVIAAAERMADAAGNRERIEGYVKLGVAEVVALTWLPEFLDRLRQDYPGVQLEIDVGLSYILEEQLLNGDLDLAFLPCTLPQSKFTQTALGQVAFRWMCSTRRPDLPAEVSAAEFMDLPIIATSREMQLRSSALAWVCENDIAFRAPTICNTFTIAAKLVAAGLGVALLPVAVYLGAIERGELRILRCVPEVEPFDMYVIRPLRASRPVDHAVERLAVEIGRRATMETAGLSA